MKSPLCLDGFYHKNCPKNKVFLEDFKHIYCCLFSSVKFKSLFSYFMLLKGENAVKVKLFYFSFFFFSGNSILSKRNKSVTKSIGNRQERRREKSCLPATIDLFRTYLLGYIVSPLYGTLLSNIH